MSGPLLLEELEWSEMEDGGTTRSVVRMAVWFAVVAVLTAAYVVWRTTASKKQKVGVKTPVEGAEKESGEDRGEKQQVKEEKVDETGPAAVLSCLLAPDGPGGATDGAACYNARTGDLCLFGGLTDSGLSDEEWLFSDQDTAWVQIESLKKPSPRAGHSAVAVGEYVVVYGGYTGTVRRYEARHHVLDPHVYLLNLATSTWVKPKLSSDDDAPPARAEASLAVDETRSRSAIVFGGVQDDETSLLDDTWRLDIVVSTPTPTLVWTRLGCAVRGQSSGFYAPAARKRHAAVVHDDSMYVFGGEGDGGAAGLAPRNALEVLDLDTDVWHLRDAGGTPPPAEPGVLAHLVAPDRICLVSPSGTGLFNRVSLLQLDHGIQPTWINLRLEWASDWTMVPGRRRRHFSCADPDNGIVFVFGGLTGTGLLNDTMIVIDLAHAAGIQHSDQHPGWSNQLDPGTCSSDDDDDDGWPPTILEEQIHDFDDEHSPHPHND